MPSLNVERVRRTHVLEAGSDARERRRRLVSKSRSYVLFGRVMNLPHAVFCTEWPGSSVGRAYD